MNLGQVSRPYWDYYLWGCLSTLTLLILTLSKVSFSDILRNDCLDHFDTFGENFDFDTFKNDTFKYGTFKNDTFTNDTFESVLVDDCSL